MAIAGKKKKKKSLGRSVNDCIPLSYSDANKIIICIPHPTYQLSQNSRAHWTVQSKEKQLVKYNVALCANIYNKKSYLNATVKPHYIWFYTRIVDRTNINARMKSAEDKFAELVGLNDRDFKDIDILRVKDSKEGLAGIVAMVMSMNGERLDLEQIAQEITDKHYSWTGKKKILGKDCFH